MEAVLDESQDDICRQGRSQFGERVESSSDVKRVFKITLLVKEHDKVELMLVRSLLAIILSAPRLLSEKQACHNRKYFTVLKLHNKPFPSISERSSNRIRRKRRICLTVGE